MDFPPNDGDQIVQNKPCLLAQFMDRWISTLGTLAQSSVWEIFASAD